MTKQSVANHRTIEVSAAAIGQYEAGTARPRARHLPAFAGLFDVPLSFFAYGRPRATIDASTAHFKSLRDTRVWQRTMAIELTELVWELANALEQRVHLPSVSLPGATNDMTGGFSDPTEAARALRVHWGIGRGPVQNLVRTMEVNGLIATFVAMSRHDDVARVDAFSTSHLPRPIVVLTPDRADHVYRHRFSAAHESGHILLHHDAEPGDPIQEREANLFAAEFLTPSDEVRSQLPIQMRVQPLLEMARRWGVPADSLVTRARELGVVSEVSARRGYQKLAEARGSRALPAEPVSKYPGETPVLLSQAFDLAIEHGMTMRELATELAWHPPMIRRFLGQPDDRPKLHLA